MSMKIEAVVHPTDNRGDAEGEFIIQLPSGAMKTLEVQDREYVVVKMINGKEIPGYPDQCFQVVAAVRNLPQGALAISQPNKEDDSGRVTPCHVRLDLTLRQAIGAKTFEEDGALAHVFVERPEFPLQRKSFTRFAQFLSYQFVVCRVQLSLAGDAETPLGRTSPAVIQSLGLKDRGVVVVLSPKRQIEVRILPLPDFKGEKRQEVTPNMTREELESWMEYDGYLGGPRGMKLGWRLPEIHLDLETRRMLGVVPGQSVWVRREPWSLLVEKAPILLSPIILALFATIIRNDDDWGKFFTAKIVIAVFVTFVLLIVFAVMEIRSQITRSRRLDSRD